MSGAHTKFTKEARARWNQEQLTGQRRCSKCKEVKNLTDFPKRTPHRDGRVRYYAYCHSCHSSYQKTLRLKKIFNLTKDEYDLLGSVCPICGRSGKTKENPVDHDHKTGLIRGRICDRCNRGLAWFKDDPNVLRKCADYLENPPAISILGKKVYGVTGRVNKRKRKRNKSVLDLTS